MKFIQNSKYITAAVIAAIMLSSCDDKLDLQPISQQTQGNAYNNGGQMEAALTGAYESFQSSDYYVWDNILYSDVRSDNHYAGGDNPEIFQIENINILTTNTRVFKLWSNVYNAISKANTVLEHAPKVTDQLTDERRQQMMGEAYFLRAYHYFNLAKLFGGVPLVLNVVTSADPSVVNVPRNTEQEVYDQVIADLNTAAEMLPDTYGSDASVNKARATKGAAYALLAKAYAQQPTPNYAEVISNANKVINSPAGYTLLSNYADLFDGNHYNNSESIIEVQFLGGNEGTWGPQMMLPPSVSGDTWRKFVTPSHDLVNAYDAEGDEVRKNANILFEDAPWSDEFWGNAVGSNIPFAYKWKNAGGWNSADHNYLIRLADILLLKAEAHNALGDIASAATEVDKIRLRAGLPVLTADQKSSQSVMKMTILKERRLELATEAHRWDDLVRNDVVVETMNALHEIDLRTNTQVNYNMQAYEAYLPIPTQEMDRNPNLTQNDGY